MNILASDVNFNKSKNVVGSPLGEDSISSGGYIFQANYIALSENKANGNMHIKVKNVNTVLLERHITGMIGEDLHSGGIAFQQLLALFVVPDATTNLGAEIVQPTASTWVLGISPADQAAGNITIELSFSGGMDDNCFSGISVVRDPDDPNGAQTVLAATLSNKVSGNMNVICKITATA